MVCGGLSLDLDASAAQLLRKASEEGYIYSTFRVNVRFRSDLPHEPLVKVKSRIKRGLGLRMEASSGKVVDTTSPELEFTLNLPSRRLELESRPVYLEGRYRKLVRYISQAKWVCRSCGGRGCLDCGFRGRHFSASVEELVTTPVSVFLKSTPVYLHAGGREDVDVRALGKGRPFVLEACDPRRRDFSAAELEEYINAYAQPFVEVELSKLTTRERVAELKQSSERNQKLYTGLVVFQHSVNLPDTGLTLRDIELVQLTPLRMLGNRADLARRKRIFKMVLKPVDLRKAEFELVCQGGTYVKEFISGDDGRTMPNLSQIMGTQARCLELDLVDVYSE